ncbi:MAG TPA: porin family protein [Paludibacter sp.]|nr:porin family protein [Paludibacter sp.]
MRKLFIFVLVTFSISAFTQSRLIAPEIYVGANVGVTESMVTFNPSVKQGFLQGYNGGLVFRYIAEKNVGMQAELNFSQRGWKESSGRYTRQLNYIELPFMTHIYIGKKNRFFINLGPKISYLISEKTILNQTTNSTELQQIASVQHPFDYGLCGGIGVLFNIKGNIFQLDSRVNYSFSDLYPNSRTDYFDNSHNLNLSVNLGWLIQVK